MSGKDDDRALIALLEAIMRQNEKIIALLEALVGYEEGKSLES